LIIGYSLRIEAEETDVERNMLKDIKKNDSTAYTVGARSTIFVKNPL